MRTKKFNDMLKKMVEGRDPKDDCEGLKLARAAIEHDDSLVTDIDLEALYGKTIGSLKKGFESLLTYCDLLDDSSGRRRTLYSLRHFYATMRLSEEVSPYLLAQQMGTSIEMLQRFYGHVVTNLIANQITKTTPKGKSSVGGTNEYPF